MKMTAELFEEQALKIWGNREYYHSFDLFMTDIRTLIGEAMMDGSNRYNRKALNSRTSYNEGYDDGQGDYRTELRKIVGLNDEK